MNRNSHSHAADINHYGADDAAPFPGATMHYSDPTTWPDHKIPAPTLQADGSIVTHTADDMALLRATREALAPISGTILCSLQTDELGKPCVRVRCGSEKTFALVVTALNGWQLNSHPTMRHALQVFAAPAPEWNEDAHADLRAMNALGMHRDLGGCDDCKPQPDPLADVQTEAGEKVTTVVVPGNSTVHVGRQIGTYASGQPQWRKVCGTSRNDRHDPMPVTSAHVTCKRCLAKLPR